MSGKCFYCDAPAVRFCDFVLGWPIGGYVRVGYVSSNRFYAVCCKDGPMFTCDMGVCETHNKQIGMFHASGAAGWSESVDRCPEHAGMKEGMATPVTADEAETLRRAVFAAARRRLIREGATL